MEDAPFCAAKSERLAVQVLDAAVCRSVPSVAVEALKKISEQALDAHEVELYFDRVVAALTSLGEQDSAVALECCRALRAIVEGEHSSNEILLGEAGICLALSQTVALYGTKDANVTFEACQLIRTLAPFEPYNFEFGEGGACKAVLDALRSSGSDTSVAGSCCGAMGSLAVTESNTTDLIQLGALSEAASVLRRYGKTDASVASQACYLIGNLIADEVDELPNALELGVCELVLDSLMQFGLTDEKVSEFGCQAICNLAVDDSCTECILQLRPETVILGTLLAFGRTNPKVCKWGCGVITNLCMGRSEQSAKFGKAGACEAVVQALNTFGSSDPEIAALGCHTCAILAIASNETQTQLGRLGACEAVITALRTFGADKHSVAEHGCAAVYTLARFNTFNTEELIQLDARRTVLRSQNNQNTELALSTLPSCHRASLDGCRLC
jgi:hypothetical protein